MLEPAKPKSFAFFQRAMEWLSVPAIEAPDSQRPSLGWTRPGSICCSWKNFIVALHQRSLDPRTPSFGSRRPVRPITRLADSASVEGEATARCCAHLHG